MHRIITIGREFGSGGREVGKRLAELLQVSYYDKEIVTRLAQRTQLAEEYINQLSEKGQSPINYFPITTGRSFYSQTNPSLLQSANLHSEQSKLLKELAEKSDCIIVGRCANYVLREFKPIRIFIYAEMDLKIQRCREKATEQENMTDKVLKQHILEVDKDRASYFKFVTGQKWDEKTNYDICINTTYCPVKEAAQIIAQLVR